MGRGLARSQQSRRLADSEVLRPPADLLARRGAGQKREFGQLCLVCAEFDDDLGQASLDALDQPLRRDYGRALDARQGSSPVLPCAAIANLLCRYRPSGYGRGQHQKPRWALPSPL